MSLGTSGTDPLDGMRIPSQTWPESKPIFVGTGEVSIPWHPINLPGSLQSWLPPNPLPRQTVRLRQTRPVCGLIGGKLAVPSGWLCSPRAGERGDWAASSEVPAADWRRPIWHEYAYYRSSGQGPSFSVFTPPHPSETKQALEWRLLLWCLDFLSLFLLFHGLLRWVLVGLAWGVLLLRRQQPTFFTKELTASQIHILTKQNRHIIRHDPQVF